jgi:hypothetical protein
MATLLSGFLCRRLQLALSQTMQIPLDFEKVHVEPIDDIPCKVSFFQSVEFR